MNRLSAYLKPQVAVAAAVALGLSVPAHAWLHTQLVWLPDDFPIPYWVADDGTEPNSLERCESSGGLEGCCEETVPAGYCTQATAEGFAAWQDGAPCAEFDVEYQGVNENLDFAFDGRYYISFNDPGNTNSLGTLAVTYSTGNVGAFILDGQQYDRFSSTDIVFSKDQQFDTHESIAGNTCNGGSNLREVMTHEIGHSLGMGHSCEDPNKGGLPCNDPVLRDATMNWTGPPCSTNGTEINEDDIEGFTALYGPYATFECSHQLDAGLSVGVVPFDLNCVIVSQYLSEVVSATWNFGDGGTSTLLAPTHTYDKAGNYTIQLTVEGEREQCGPEGWENNFRRVGYVRACDVPEAAFEVTHVDGLKYQMLNDSNVAVYGCISNIEWTVFEGDKPGGKEVVSGISAWEPTFDLPEAGTYTVVMNLGGIAGTGAAVATFDARNTRGEGRGCTTGAGGASAAGLLALGLLAVRRRRRA